MLTVTSLVREHTRVPASASYLFCRTANCEAVYFSEQAVFTKPDLKVRVGLKETADPIPLCYCFDYSGEDIRRDIEATGKTLVLEEIRAEVQGVFCACEVKNPSRPCLKSFNGSSFKMSVLTRGRRFSGPLLRSLKDGLLLIYPHNQVEIGGNCTFQVLGKKFLD